jgi:hypothetical protein
VVQIREKQKIKKRQKKEPRTKWPLCDANEYPWLHWTRLQAEEDVSLKQFSPSKLNLKFSERIAVTADALIVGSIVHVSIQLSNSDSHAGQYTFLLSINLFALRPLAQRVGCHHIILVV